MATPQREGREPKDVGGAGASEAAGHGERMLHMQSKPQAGSFPLLLEAPPSALVGRCPSHRAMLTGTMRAGLCHLWPRAA